MTERIARTALITGGSRGIGAACSRWFAARGHRVVINYRSRDAEAESLRDELAALGADVALARFDVRDAAATREALRTELARGPVHILVNNAGIARDAPFPAITDDEWIDVTRTTLDGFFNVTRELVMPMARAKFGRVINISSVSGVAGNRGQVNYSAAKAGLIGATRSLSLEMAKRHVTVNAVAPGLIDTEMLGGVPVEEALTRIPMRRLGKPEEVAELVGFLSSEAAAYITGQVIGINGGLV
jgi:3-oxoacyl-[acyl-carrier protein] reductase